MTKTLALRIKEIRESLKLDQADFAKRCGVTQSAVSRWERGSEPSPDHLDKIAKAGRITIDELLGRRVAPPAQNQGRKINLLVELPSEETLTAMFDGLLRSADLDDAADLHARTLAQRFPSAFRLALAPQDHAAASTAPEKAIGPSDGANQTK